MTQTDMADKDRRKPNRIPVRFVGDEGKGARARGEQPEVKGEGGPTPDEIGRESAYEDATETKRRVGRGEEQDTEAGRAGADDTDVAGGPDPSELPRSRTDQDTTVSHSDEGQKAAGGGAVEPTQEQPRKADPASGPALAELIATRAELRRVEAEARKLAEERQDLLDRLPPRQADLRQLPQRTQARPRATNKPTPRHARPPPPPPHEQ